MSTREWYEVFYTASSNHSLGADRSVAKGDTVTYSFPTEATARVFANAASSGLGEAQVFHCTETTERTKVKL